MNPKGRPPGPTMPTLLLKDAFLLAAQRAGGDGPDGLVNYLQGVATTNPGVFVSALGRIIPFQVDVQGSGNITIEIIKRFEEDPPIKTIEHGNGHANGHHNGGTGKKNTAAE